MDELRRLWRETLASIAGVFEAVRGRLRREPGDATSDDRRPSFADAPSEANDDFALDDSAIVVATADDDVASVVGRIDIAEAPSVILIVRRDARALRRATAWPHIAAHVRRRGVDLSVVSPRGDVRAHARANGLSSARTPAGLRRRTVYVRSLDRTVTLPRMPWERLVRGGMIVVALGTFAVVGCYRVPSAVVTIVPDSEVVSVVGTARPNSLVDQSELATETIMVSTIRRQFFTVVTTTTTGEIEVGDEHAILEVTFENAGADLEQVPRLTRVLTEDGITFLTDQNVDVPAEGTASVGATAEFPGEPGNVDADALVQIGPGVSPSITIVGSTAGSGGTNRLTAAVAQEDVERVREIAADVLNRVAVGALLQFVEEDERGTLIPSSVTAAIFSEQPVQLLEEPSEIFIVEYTIAAAGLVVSPAQAEAYGELLVREDLPPGTAFLPGSVVAEVTPHGEDGRVQVRATGRVAALAEVAETASRITGMRPAAAANLLQSDLGLAAPPSIEIRPNFIPWVWLPRRASNIELVIAGPAPEVSDTPPEDGAPDDDQPDEGDPDDDAG
ncbi:MAG: baseplate J/gp47 family protein [Chloroflexi bacterium]|nr:baseplate J/gp47 family protein [Chloroflexota bacterium]